MYSLAFWWKRSTLGSFRPRRQDRESALLHLLRSTACPAATRCTLLGGPAARLESTHVLDLAAERRRVLVAPELHAAPAHLSSSRSEPAAAGRS